MVSKKKVLVITTDNPSEGKIVKHLHPVTAHVVAGTNLFSDFFAGMSDIFGGRSGSYKKKLSSIYSEAIERIRQEAKRVGANGVVGLKIDIDEISGQGKSMFMITAIGTAVIIRKEEKDSTVKSKGSDQFDRVDNETVQRLRHTKDLKQKAENGSLQFNSQVWDFLIQNRITEFFPFVIGKVEKMLGNPTVYTPDSINQFLENTANYIRSLDMDDQKRVIYKSLMDPEISLEVEGILLSIVEEDLLMDFSEVRKLLQDKNLTVRKRGMILSTYDRPYYTTDEIDGYSELVKYIEINFPQRGSLTTKKQLLSSKEKEVWECECGKINDSDATYCGRCSLDIYGFSDTEIKPPRAAQIIKEKIILFSEPLESQRDQEEL